MLRENLSSSSYFAWLSIVQIVLNQLWFLNSARKIEFCCLEDEGWALLTVRGVEIVIIASEKLFTTVAEVVACDIHPPILAQQPRFPGAFT